MLRSREAHAKGCNDCRKPDIRMSAADFRNNKLSILVNLCLLIVLLEMNAQCPQTPRPISKASTI